MYLCWGGGGGGGGGGYGMMFDDKFVYVNTVCFDVSCFNLRMKWTCSELINFEKGCSKPHSYYYLY